MEYSKIIAISGLAGLFEVINSRSDGAIVRSLDDNKMQFISNRAHSLSQLENIEVFTQKENVNLVEVFISMEKADGVLPDVKDTAAVKKYFEKVFPEMDFEKVYDSDRKKMIKWFEELHKHHRELKLSEIPEETEEEIKEEPVIEEKPKKKK